MSRRIEFAPFTTPLGECVLAWGSQGITALQLPEANPAEACARINGRFTSAVRAAVLSQGAISAIEQVNALLTGSPVTFSDVELDMSGISPFYQRVYKAAQRIPPATTCSYGEVARWLSAPTAARAVGQALGRNPFAIIVPCHRVVAASGKFGGFSAWGGLDTKRRLLQLEAGERHAHVNPVGAAQIRA